MENGVNLFGTVGRKSGSVTGFNYTDANFKKEDMWSKEMLSEYLDDPNKNIPRTKMVFPGFKKSQENQ
jgi:cytochrome c